MVSVILSAIITVISGWGIQKIGVITSQQIILVLGVLITVISTWGAFFSPKESWHLYADTLHKLRALQAELEFETCLKSNIADDEEKLKASFNRYQEILRQHNQAWIELRKSRIPDAGK
jgi:hypothetical protein